MASISVTVHGPIFDRSAPAEVEHFMDELRYEVGGQALANVQGILNQSIRHPTPYYETQVKLDRQADQVIVDDSGVIYGPWLEGTGSRNRTTRFKGYHAFRTGTQQTESRIPAIAAALLGRLIARLGG